MVQNSSGVWSLEIGESNSRCWYGADQTVQQAGSRVAGSKMVGPTSIRCWSDFLPVLVPTLASVNGASAGWRRFGAGGGSVLVPVFASGDERSECRCWFRHGPMMAPVSGIREGRCWFCPGPVEATTGSKREGRC